MLVSKEKIISFTFAAVVAFIVTFCIKMLFLNEYTGEITGVAYDKAVNEIPKIASTVKVIKEPTVKILMSRVEIKKGTTLTADMVEWRDWPKSILSKNYIATENGKNINPNLKIDAFIGLKTSANIDKSLPLTEIMFFKKGEISDSEKDIKVRDGMRAFTVNVNQTSVSNKMFFPGDIVDVYLSTSKIFYRNVKILALDDKGSVEEIMKAIELEKKKNEENKKSGKDNENSGNPNNKRYLPKTVTLELTPEQIGQIVPSLPPAGVILILISDMERKEYMQKYQDEYIEEVKKEEDYELSLGVQSYSTVNSKQNMEVVGPLISDPEDAKNENLSDDKYIINVTKRDKTTAVEVSESGRISINQMKTPEKSNFVDNRSNINNERGQK